jgi:hypothetical protein
MTGRFLFQTRILCVFSGVSEQAERTRENINARQAAGEENLISTQKILKNISWQRSVINFYF